jgi:hypothetical protein
MRKLATLLLITVLTVSSLLMVGSAFAQSIPKPSVPEFTVKYVDLSYYEPPTYGVDQFTGETVITNEGYYVDNKSVAFKIVNQPFTSFNDSSGNYIALYYNFRFKGLFGDEWFYYPFSESGGGTHRYSAMFYVLSDQSPKLEASDSEYTDIFLGLPFLFGAFNPKVGSLVDFQVQALIGHIVYEGDGFYSYVGQRSDWSNTQTIEVGESQTSSPEPTTPTSPTPLPTDYTGVGLTETEIVIGVAVTIVVLAIGMGLLVYLIKRK